MQRFSLPDPLLAYVCSFRAPASRGTSQPFNSPASIWEPQIFVKYLQNRVHTRTPDVLSRCLCCLFDESEVCYCFTSGPVPLAFLLPVYPILPTYWGRTSNRGHGLAVALSPLLYSSCFNAWVIGSFCKQSSKLSSLESSTVPCFGQGYRTKCHPCLFLDIPYPAMVHTRTKKRSLPKGFTKDRRNHLKTCFVKYGFARYKTLMATNQTLDAVW